MAAGDTKSMSTAPFGGRPQVVTLTGLSASTNYTVTIQFPNGQMASYDIKTDGSGAFVMPPVACHERGTYTMTVYTVPTSAYSTTWKAS